MSGAGQWLIKLHSAVLLEISGDCSFWGLCLLHVLASLGNSIKKGVVTSSFVLNVSVFSPWQIKLCTAETPIPDIQKYFEKLSLECALCTLYDNILNAVCRLFLNNWSLSGAEKVEVI